MNNNDNQYQDLHLFEEMKNATETRRNELAWQVVQTHLGYIHTYARMTALKSWTKQTYEDYTSLLIETAHSCAIKYDLSKTDQNGDRIPFVGMFRTWAKSARYQIAAQTNPMTQSRGSKDISVAVQKAASTLEGRGEKITTESVMAEIEKTRKNIPAVAVKRALNPIKVAAIAEGQDVAGDDNPEAIAIAKLELEQLAKLRPVIAKLDNRDRDILTAIMNGGNLADIARNYGVSRQAIQKRQMVLLSRLRAELD